MSFNVSVEILGVCKTYYILKVKYDDEESVIARALISDFENISPNAPDEIRLMDVEVEMEINLMYNNDDFMEVISEC